MSAANCTKSICEPYGGHWNGTFCHCNVYAQGFCCTVTLPKAYPQAFLAFQIISGIVFPILFVATAWVLYNLKRPSKVHILMFSMLLWTCAVRTLWLWLDPFNSRRLVPPVFEQVLYGNGLWSLLSVYITVLGLWYYIWVKSRHLGNAELRELKTKRAAIAIFLALGLFFVTNTGLDVLRWKVAASERTLPRVLTYGFYFLNVLVFVGVPGILYFTLGRRLETELSKFNTINGSPQVQDGYIKKITHLTTSSCIIAGATVSIIITAFVVISILSFRGKLKPSIALGFHVLYRIIEVSYMLSVLGIFYFKVHNKSTTGKYVRMK